MKTKELKGIKDINEQTLVKYNSWRTESKNEE